MHWRGPHVLIKSRRGSVLVEYALVLVAVLLFVVGIGDTGRLLWVYTGLSHAVDAAARCGSIAAPGCATAAQTATFAATQAYGLTVPAAAFTVSGPACGYQVDVTYTFTFVIPWPGASPLGPSNAITITRTACYPT